MLHNNSEPRLYSKLGIPNANQIRDQIRQHKRQDNRRNRPQEQRDHRRSMASGKRSRALRHEISVRPIHGGWPFHLKIGELKKVLIIGSGAIKIGEAGEFDYSTSQAIKALREEGILEKHSLRVLGTSIRSIELADNRELFKTTMQENGIPVPKSGKASDLESAIAAAKEIGYPVIVRVAYTLGGQGSGVAFDEAKLKEIARRGLAYSRIRQILVEEYLDKWKEVEYEVMRDQDDNCTIVCNMENLDPMGIHTGDSIVVAPSQTLTNREFNNLRSTAQRVIRALGIVGECNIQFALDPQSEDFRVIEVNSRLSRSSALASKATGYPIAYIAAEISIGYTLPE